MQIKSFAITLALGMAAGAAAAMVLPKQPQVRRAVCRAADGIETAAQQARDSVCGC